MRLLKYRQIHINYHLSPSNKQLDLNMGLNEAFKQKKDKVSFNLLSSFPQAHGVLVQSAPNLLGT